MWGRKVIRIAVSLAVNAKQAALKLLKQKTALLKQKTALLKQAALLKQKALSYPDTAAAASAVCIYYVILGGRFAPP